MRLWLTVRRIALTIATLSVVLSAETRDSKPLTTHAVAMAMEQCGWKVTATQVKFLSEISIVGSDTRLQVVEVAPWVKNTLKAKLRCLDPHACLPFYVLITGTAEHRERSPEAVEPAARVEMSGTKPLMHSGDPATMIFANHGLRISMPVICLQNGRQGQTVRVTTADHRRFYKAEILGPGLLKAEAL
jgi:hypothetical protein